MNKKMLYRILIYIAGLLTLALGIILNTKAGLGVSPIISISYSISEITKTNFGNMTFVLYGVFVLIEFKSGRWNSSGNVRHMWQRGRFGKKLF